VKIDRKTLSIEIATRTTVRIVEIEPKRGKRNPSFTKAELESLGQNKWAIAERERLIRTWEK